MYPCILYLVQIIALCTIPSFTPMATTSIQVICAVFLCCLLCNSSRPVSMRNGIFREFASVRVCWWLALDATLRLLLPLKFLKQTSRTSENFEHHRNNSQDEPAIFTLVWTGSANQVGKEDVRNSTKDLLLCQLICNGHGHSPVSKAPFWPSFSLVTRWHRID